MARTLDAITFSIADCDIVRCPILVGDLWRFYPRVADWPAGRVSDAINPRSHGDGVLAGPVADAIRRTLADAPTTFALANRGILLFASRVEIHAKTVTVHFGGDPVVRGLADGGTTDAVLAAAQAAGPVSPLAAVAVEVIVGHNDPDEVALIVEGRNTSRQVRTASLVNAGGHFDWLKAALPAHQKDRIAWEENSPGLPVSEVLGLLAMFRPGIGRPTAPGPGAVDRDAEHQWAAAAAAAYRDRAKMAVTLRDPAVLAAFQATAPLARAVLDVYEVVWEAIAADADQKVARKTQLKAARWDMILPRYKHEARTPFGSFAVKRRVPTGWLFPAVGAAAVFVKDGRLDFGTRFLTDALLPAVVKRISHHVDRDDITPDRFAKSPLSYDTLAVAVAVAASKRLSV